MELTNETPANCTLESPQVVARMDMLDSLLLPCIAVFGILGNLFSIAIFQRGTKLRRLASSVYLIALATSDTIFLFTLLLSTPALSVLGHSSAVCKTIIYFMNVSGVFSAWLVVLFTVERFIVIAFPLTHVARCSSRSRARYLVLFMLPLPCLMYVYTAVVLIDVDQDGICQPKHEYLVVTTILHCVEISFTYFLPAFIVVALNIRIGVQLIRSGIERREMKSGSVSLATESTLALACRAVIPDSPMRLVAAAGTVRKSKPERVSSLRNQRSVSSASEPPRRSRIGSTAPSAASSASENAITRTLIVISTSFALLNLPHNVVLLVKLCAQLTGIGECFARSDFMYVLTSVCYALYYANFATNILVYHMTSSNYREGAKELIARWTICLSTCGRRILLQPPPPPYEDGSRTKKTSSSIRNGTDFRWQHRPDSRSLTPCSIRRPPDEDPMLLSTITEAEVNSPYLNRR